MKRLFWLLLFLAFTWHTVQAQADPRRFTWGAGNMLGAAWDFPTLVKEQRTHARFVCRVNAAYPGNNQPPVMSVDEPLIRAQIKAAFAAGLKGIIIAVEGTRQENSALYGSIRASGDASRFDAAYRQAARIARSYPSTRVMLEIAAGEPGFTVDAYKYVTTGNKDVYAEAQRINQVWIDHLVPIIRAEYPRLTLIIPGCSYSTGYGSVNDLLAATKRPPANAYFSQHWYQMRRYSHNDGVSYPMLKFNWPEAEWEAKVSAAGEDPNAYAYQAGYKTWDEAGMAQSMDTALMNANALGGRLYVAEYGTPAPWRPFASAYLACVKMLWQKRGVGTCEWRG